jgi:hypothetical protein
MPVHCRCVKIHFIEDAAIVNAAGIIFKQAPHIHNPLFVIELGFEFFVRASCKPDRPFFNRFFRLFHELGAKDQSHGLVVEKIFFVAGCPG